MASGINRERSGTDRQYAMRQLRRAIQEMLDDLEELIYGFEYEPVTPVRWV